MIIYLVGGAVRDELLNLPIKEKDWVVIGSNISNMINMGYKKVGRNFPVFINPISKEEYSLARKEKKIGNKHTDFELFFSEKTTLIEDLYRRDLTINAIAKDNNGKIIDPYFGLKDIKNKILKHISNNFIDDSLRVLRLARFFSYLYHLNFKISIKTYKLVKNINKNNYLKYISSERIWMETKKALTTNNPEYYFIFLKYTNSIIYIFPEINYLFNKYSNIEFKNIFIKENIYIINIENNYITRFLYILIIIYKELLIKKKYNIYYIFKLNIKKMLNRLKVPNIIKNISLKIHYFYKLNNELNLINLYKIVFYVNFLKLNKNKFILNKFINLFKINDDKFFLIKYKKIYYTKKNFLYKIINIINNLNIKKIINKYYINKNIKNKIINEQINVIKRYFSYFKRVL